MSKNIDHESLDERSKKLNYMICWASDRLGNNGIIALPFYRYAENGDRIDNITNWGL